MKNFFDYTVDELTDIYIADYEQKKYILQNCALYGKTKKGHNDKDLETLAQALMEYETLSGDEIKDVLAGKTISRAEQSPVAPEKQTKVSVPEV